MNRNDRSNYLRRMPPRTPMRQEFVEWTNVRVEDGEFVVVDRSTSAAQRDRNGAYATRNPGQETSVDSEPPRRRTRVRPEARQANHVQVASADDEDEYIDEDQDDRGRQDHPGLNSQQTPSAGPSRVRQQAPSPPSQRPTRQRGTRRPHNVNVREELRRPRFRHAMGHFRRARHEYEEEILNIFYHFYELGRKDERNGQEHENRSEHEEGDEMDQD